MRSIVTWRKLLSFLLCLVMIFGMVPRSAFAVSDGEPPVLIAENGDPSGSNPEVPQTDSGTSQAPGEQPGNDVPSGGEEPKTEPGTPQTQEPPGNDVPSGGEEPKTDPGTPQTPGEQPGNDVPSGGEEPKTDPGTPQTPGEQPGNDVPSGGEEPKTDPGTPQTQEQPGNDVPSGGEEPKTVPDAPQTQEQPGIGMLLGSQGPQTIAGDLLIPDGLQNSGDTEDPNAGDTRTAGGTYALTAPDFQLATSLTINGAPLSPTTRYQNGDSFSLTLNWIVPNSYNNPSNQYTYTFSDSVFQLSDVSGAMHNGKESTDPDYVVYGSYSITGGALTVTYNEAFYALSNRYSSLTLGGTLVITEETITDPNGGYTFAIPGLNSYTVSLFTQNGLRVEKTGTRVVDNANGQIRYDYTVTVTALKNNTDVHVWDGLQVNGGSNQSLRLTGSISTTLNGQSYSDFTSSAFLSSVTNVVSSTDTYRVADLVIPSMSAGNVFQITYSMAYTEADRSSDNPYPETPLTNTAKASSSENAEVTDCNTQTLRSSWIHKKAERNADNNLLWTISVDPGHFTELTLKDILGDRQSCPDETPVSVYATDQVKSATGGTLWETTTFGALKNGYSLTWPEGSQPYRVIQFVSIPESGIYWENTARLEEPNREYKASYSVGSTSPTIVRKTLDHAEHIGNPGTRAYLDLRLFSTIEMTVGNEAQSLGSEFFLADVPIANYTNSAHTFEEVKSIKVRNETTQVWEDAADRFVVTTETYNNKSATYFRFVDSHVIPGTYQIQLTTTLAYRNTIPGGSDTVSNNVYWKRPSTNDGNSNWRCWWTLKKPSKSATEIKNDQIVWKVALPNLKNTLQDIDSKEFVLTDDYNGDSGTTVTDTLPAGLQFVCAAYGNSDPQPDCEGAVTPEVTENADGTTTLVFPVQPSNDLYIRTKYNGNYMALTEAKTFTNTVQINLRTQPNDSPVDINTMKATAKGTITPPKPVAKTSVYDTSTAPFVQYTVKLNESAADMIPAEATSQTYKIIDTMGSALELDTTSILINDAPLSAYPNLTMTLTENGFEMDGFEDGTPYVITYQAVITLAPDGTAVFPMGSAANTLTIPEGYIPGGEVTVTTEQTGQILYHSGISGGETAQMRIVKTDDTAAMAPVSGAVFTVYDYGTGYAPAETGTFVQTLTTNEYGQTPFMDVTFGKIYGIQETTVPEGYTDPNDGAIRYFVRRAQDLTGEYEAGIRVFESGAFFELPYVNHKLLYGNLTVTKTVAGNAGDVNKAFAFTVTLDGTTVNGTFGDMTFVNGVASFSLAHGQSKTATGLLEGLTYTVTEENYSADGYVTTKTGDTGSIVGNGTATAAFTNTRDLAYSLRITKQNSADTPLSGAGFKLYSDSGCTQLAEIYVDASGTTRLADVANDSTLWTNADGQVFFYDLQCGSTYYIKEFRTPTGYTLLSEPLTLSLDENGAATIATVNGTYPATVTADKQIQITVTDQKINTDIPLTGGGGVLLYTIGGDVLMAAAVGLLIYRKKRDCAR